MIDAQHNQGGGRGQVLEGRWSRPELARLRGTADPEIDRVVAAYHRQHPELTDPRDLVRSMIQELSQAKRDPQRFTRAAANPDGTWLTETLAIALAPPRWQPDPDSRLLGPLQPVAHALLRRLGRHVLISYSDRYSNGQGPFRVPPESERGTRRRRS